MKQLSHKRGAHQLIDVLLWTCLLVLLVGVIAGIAFQIEAIAFRYPLDYGEAPLINQAAQLTSGNPIYRPDLEQPPYTVANYPPVYVGILALFESAFGPAFWYGRLISALSAIGSSVFIILILFSRSHNLFTSLLPGLLFLNIPYVISWSTLARIDHTTLIFALAGIYFLFRKEVPQKCMYKDFILGSIFLILAIYTRQSYALAAPFACFLYLLQKKWKQGLLLIAVVGGTSLLIFLILNLLTKGGFYFNIVTANINPFGFERMVNNFRNFLESAPIIFILAILGLILSYKRINGWPMLVGFAVGGFLSALTIGKIGSNVNYFLELAAALCLLIGFSLVVLVRSQSRWGSILMLSIAILLLIWQGIHLIQEVQQNSRDALQQRQKSYDALETMETMVRQNANGPILADEYMGMIVLSGQDLYLQPFEITQLVNAGNFDQEVLLEKIRNEAFSLILIQEGSWWQGVAQERWTPEMLETIKNNYRLYAQLENTSVYQPRTRQAAEVKTSCPTGVWTIPSSTYLGYQYQDGFLVLYSAGAEGDLPVIAPADGFVYRPSSFPDGSLSILNEDPFNPEEKVITLFTDMRSFDGRTILISEDFPLGAEGISVSQGDLLGYQSNWAGQPFFMKWLHVNIGVAEYSFEFLSDFDALTANLINPADYFGIVIDPDANQVKQVECQTPD